MRSVFQQLFPKKNYDACIAAAIGFFIIYIYTRHSGIGVSPDSVVYMSAARNVHAHALLNDFYERPLVVFPAFYPFFLSAVITVTGLDPMVFAPILNALLFAIIIYSSGWIMENFQVRSKWYKHIILSCIVLSPCLLEIYSMLWSETLFILLLLFFIIALRHYFKFYTFKSLLLVSLIAALACITRYAGVTLIGTGALLILLDNKILLKKKLIPAFLFGLMSSSLLAINLIRNTVSDGTFTGMREKSLASLTTNLYYYGNILCEWLPFPKDHFILAFSVALIFLGCFALLMCRNFKKTSFFTFENIAVVFFLVYSLFIILSATFSRYELMNSRLLSPLFIPMLLGGTSWIVPVTKKFWIKQRLWMIVITALLVFAFQRHQYKADYENYDRIKDAGIPGYTEDSWQKDSEIVNFLKKNTSLFKKGYAIYSNSDDALYFSTGLRCDMLPHKVFAEEINNYYIEPNCYLVWFDDIDNPELLSLDDVLTHKKMILLYKFSNGSIYVTAPAK
jgi:hypothetical protein